MSNQDIINYEVIVQEDPETGDLILPIPQELLDRMGWREGDDLEWNQTTDGAWLLSKAVK
jgi:hypothetical protein